jgi:predicted nucleotidyltransferase
VVEAFLTVFAEWARLQDDIAAVALVGSHARGSARLDSDVDLVILADDPGLYLRDPAWTRQFGSPVRQRVEHYGRLTSIRVWYPGQLEVEFGIADRTWAADAGAHDVIASGIRVLFDRGSVLPKEPFDQKVSRVLAEEIEIVPYDPRWPDQFHEEKRRLLALLPNELIRRIEHFGSTAVPGLAAKPVVDMLVEVTDLEETRARIVPILGFRPTRV